METDESIVEDSLSRFGLHRLHVIRIGGPVDEEKWIAERLHAADDARLIWRYEEPELGVHHLWLYWKEEGNEA